MTARPSEPAHLLQPAALAALGDLRLAASAVVEGFLAGLHRSRRAGAGGEFLQYRAYQPGDDPHRLDWRAYARSGRLYVRETETEREVSVRFVVDATASMAHEDRTLDPPLSKIAYARFATAALAWLAARQGDRLMLSVVSGGEVVDWTLRPRERRGLDRLLHALVQAEPRGDWPTGDALDRLEHPAHGWQRQLVIGLSDLHSHAAAGEPGAEDAGALNDPDAPPPGPLATFSRLAAQGHEVLVLHLLGRDELEFRYQGDLLFEDLETGHTVRGNAEELRPAYLAALDRDLAAAKRCLRSVGARYELLPLDEPLDHALRRFLSDRLARREAVR